MIRRAGLVLAAAALPLALAGPAAADVPEGWSDPPEVSLVQLLLVVAAIPLALALVISLAVYAPAMRRGERLTPGAGARDEWFGGPRRDTAELENPRPDDSTGGASGSW